MRYSKSFTFILLFIFCCSIQLNAQEQLGLKLENYSGINSVLLNPTYAVTSPYKWNVNLVSAGTFFDNNYAYINDVGAFKVLRNIEDIRPRPDIDTENENPEDFLILDFYGGTNKKQGSYLATVMGPSVMVNLKSGFSFGIFTNVRTAASARGIPTSLNYYQFDNEDFNNDFSVAPFKAAAMSWSEIGVNLAKQFETTSGTVALGLNLKMLNGYEAFYFNNKSTFDMTKISEDELSFETLDVEYAFTNSNINNDKFDLSNNGGGIGLDLGFSYIKGDINNYFWKAGLSLNDLGRIRFVNHAEQHQINSNTLANIDLDAVEAGRDIEEQTRIISEQLLNNPDASESDNNFKIWLPTALTAYIDYRLTDNIYLNALAIQNVPVGENAITRDNQIALTPRYERRRFGAMLPVTLLNYSKLRVGAAARLGFLTIGSENLSSLFKEDEFTGTDFYVGIKINPFNLNWPSRKGGKGKNVKCYSF